MIVVFRIREKFFLPINASCLFTFSSALFQLPVLLCLPFLALSFISFSPLRLPPFCLSSFPDLSPRVSPPLPLSHLLPLSCQCPSPPPLRPVRSLLLSRSPQSYVSCCLCQWLSSPCLSLSPTVLHTHFLISFHYHQVILQFLLSLCFTVLLPCQKNGVNAFFRLLIKQKSEIWLTK